MRVGNFLPPTPPPVGPAAAANEQPDFGLSPGPAGGRVRVGEGVKIKIQTIRTRSRIRFPKCQTSRKRGDFGRIWVGLAGAPGTSFQPLGPGLGRDKEQRASGRNRKERRTRGGGRKKREGNGKGREGKDSGRPNRPV